MDGGKNWKKCGDESHELYGEKYSDNQVFEYRIAEALV